MSHVIRPSFDPRSSRGNLPIKAAPRHTTLRYCLLISPSFEAGATVAHFLVPFVHSDGSVGRWCLTQVESLEVGAKNWTSNKPIDRVVIDLAFEPAAGPVSLARRLFLELKAHFGSHGSGEATERVQPRMPEVIAYADPLCNPARAAARAYGWQLLSAKGLVPLVQRPARSSIEVVD